MAAKASQSGAGNKAWSVVGEKRFNSRDEVWANRDAVSLAQNMLNNWYQGMLAEARADALTGGAKGKKEVVVCYWVGLRSDGKPFEFVNDNTPGPDTYLKVAGERKALGAGAKPTICAEDILFAEHGRSSRWVLYSAAFNMKHGKSWPACSGCRARLEEAGIAEPFWNGRDR